MARYLVPYVALLLVAARTTLAQQPTPRASADTAGAADSLWTMELDPVVVTATRAERRATDVGVPVSVIGQEEIDAQGSVRATDLLADQPGLTIDEDHGSGLQMRGLDPEYTLILLDGEPVVGRTAGPLDLDRRGRGRPTTSTFPRTRPSPPIRPSPIREKRCQSRSRHRATRASTSTSAPSPGTTRPCRAQCAWCFPDAPIPSPRTQPGVSAHVCLTSAHSPLSHSIDDSSLIFRTENGRVLRCACCDRIEVVFGNVSVAEEPYLFKRFRRLVNQLDVDAQARQHEVERPILLSVDGDRFALRFTREEARELEELLDGAAAMLEPGEMIDDALGPNRTNGGTSGHPAND